MEITSGADLVGDASRSTIGKVNDCAAESVSLFLRAKDCSAAAPFGAFVVARLTVLAALPR